MNDKAEIQTQAPRSNHTDDRPRMMTLTEHFSRVRGFTPESPEQAGKTQQNAGVPNNVALRIHWDEFSDQHPEVKDVLPGQLVAPLIARCQDTAWGRQAILPGGDVLFGWKQQAFGYVSTAMPNTQVTKGFVTNGDDVLATAYGIVMQKPTGQSNFSSEYGIGYFFAWETVTMPYGPTAATDLARCAVFKVRSWFAPTAVLTALSGDGQTVYRGNYFNKISASVTDGSGSPRAVEDMVITFSIISGDVTFSQSGNTARYSRISNNGKVAAVTVEDGYAIAPSLKAGSNPGACQIRAATPLAGGATLTFTVNVT